MSRNAVRSWNGSPSEPTPLPAETPFSVSAEPVTREEGVEPLTAEEEGMLRAQLAADTYWVGPARVARLFATLDAERATTRVAPGLREVLESDILPWLQEDRSVTRDDVVRRLRKVLAYTAIVASSHD